ncbi:TonB-dependent receptor [bacterium]|nr:TonB-dependent receptor [bacterium]RQV94373.1 MAG: TonB-dependent receptor [bacterium]
MLKHKTARFFLLAVVFVTQSVLAAGGQLSGTITNKETGQPIPDANIVVLNTKMGTVSKDGGFYFLNNLPEGRQQIQVSVIGFTIMVKDVLIPEEKFLHVELEPKAIEFDPVVITATLSEHRQSNVTVAIDVLTQIRMQELSGNTTGEIVQSISGVYANRYDGFAGLNTPSIRGSEAAQVLVLMDGMRLNTVQGGGVDLNTIPLATVQRVEVIKGGHSALLGSDAVGGAIHLLSNDIVGLKGFNYDVNTTLGSFGTQIYTVSGSQQLGPLSLFASYNRTQSDGDFKYKDPQSGILEKRINNDSRTDNIFLKSKVKINTLNTFQVVYHYYHTRNGNAGNVNVSPWTDLPQTTPLARSDIKRNALIVESENRITNRFYLKEQAGYHTYDYHYMNPDDWPPTDDLHKNKSLSAEVQGIYTMSNHLTVTGGINYQKDDLSSNKFIRVDSRTMKSLFGQIELKHDLGMTRWIWIPAIRWDDYSDVGSSTSPKLGVMVNTGQNTHFALKGNVGKSYRVPTFNDLYWPADAYTEGNPDLDPEKGTNFDVGVLFSNYGRGFFQIEVTYFNNHIKDLIAWASGTDWIWRPTNVGIAKIRGIESEIQFRLPSEMAYIHINYTRMKATNETKGSGNKGKWLIYRPENKWDILVGTKLGPFYGNLNYRVVSKSYTTADNLTSLDGYQILDGNIGTAIAISGLKIGVRLQGLNLMNKMIFLTDGYPLPGREFRFTVGIEY